MTETCANLRCDPNTPADIEVWVFVPGGSYPLFVCSDEHFESLRADGAEHGAEVRKGSLYEVNPVVAKEILGEK